MMRTPAAWMCATLLLLLGACVPLTPATSNPVPLPPPSRAYVGTLEVDGPSAFLNRSPVASGVAAYSGDNVSTGAATSVIVHLPGDDYIQLDENTDPTFTFLEEANCLLAKIFSGEVFVHSHNT